MLPPPLLPYDSTAPTTADVDDVDVGMRTATMAAIVRPQGILAGQTVRGPRARVAPRHSSPIRRKSLDDESAAKWKWM